MSQAQTKVIPCPCVNCHRMVTGLKYNHPYYEWYCHVWGQDEDENCCPIVGPGCIKCSGLNKCYQWQPESEKRGDLKYIAARVLIKLIFTQQEKLIDWGSAKGKKFALSTGITAEGIWNKVKEKKTATEKQLQALRNIKSALEKWR